MTVRDVIVQFKYHRVSSIILVNEISRETEALQIKTRLERRAAMPYIEEQDMDNLYEMGENMRMNANIRIEPKRQ